MMSSLLDQFNRVSKSKKDDIALIGYDSLNGFQYFTYKNLIEWSTLIYHHVQEHILEKHTCVGLLMTHNKYIPSLVISLHKSHKSFVFFDPYISSDESLQTVQKLGIKWVFTFGCKKSSALFELYNLQNKLILSKAEALELYKFKDDICSCSYENICYIICTSGTTGAQKVVRVQNDCILSNIRSLRQIFKLTNKDVIYFGTALTFDPCIIELFLALTTGAKLIIVPHNVHINPKQLLSVLFSQEHSITFLQMSPSVFLRWSFEEIEHIFQKSTLKILALGGEAFPSNILNVSKRKPRIFNLYGITEVSCWASALEITDETKEIHLGKCLDDTVIEIRDESNARLYCGEGELFIGSNLRKCIIDDEDTSQIEGTIFRATGDIVKAQNEKFYYLGRKNDCVKRFGVRINLEEITNRILLKTSIQNKCIWYEKESKLLLFLLIKDCGDNTLKEKIVDKIRVKLLHELPKEHFPDFIDAVVNFPLTINGKLDKNALIDIFTTTKTQKLPSAKPIEVFDSLLLKYFGLGKTTLDAYLNYSFFDIGGNSILIIQFLEEFKTILLKEIPKELVTFLFEKNLNCCRKYISEMQDLKRAANWDEKESHSREKLMKTEPMKEIIKMEVLWKYDLQACVDCSPMVIKNSDGSSIIAIGSFSHIFVLLDAKTGQEILKIVFPDTIESACCISSIKQLIFVGCFDGKMRCVSIEDKSVIWEYQTGDRIKCTPCMCMNDSAVVFGSYDKHVYCIESAMGTEIWKVNVGASVTSNPICNSEKIYVATIAGNCSCLSAKNGLIFWSCSLNSPVFGSPFISNDKIYWPSVVGTVNCISCADGKKVCHFEAGGYIYSSLIFYKNCIIFGCNNHKLYSLSCDENTLELKFDLVLDSAISSTPCVFAYALVNFIAAATVAGSVYLINFETGEINSKIVLSGQIFSSPCAIDDILYLGCRDNNLYSIRLKNVNKDDVTYLLDLTFINFVQRLCLSRWQLSI